MKFKVQRYRGNETGTLDIVAETEEEKSALAKLANELKGLLGGSHYELHHKGLGCTGITNDGRYVNVNHIMYTIRANDEGEK